LREERDQRCGRRTDPTRAGAGVQPSPTNGARRRRRLPDQQCGQSGQDESSRCTRASVSGRSTDYIYKPFKGGSFASGAKGRITAFLKAGATALFDKREIRLAAEDVKADATLCKLIAAPLHRLADTLDGIGSKIKGGNTSGVDDANTQITGITSASSSNGAPITETTDQSTG